MPLFGRKREEIEKIKEAVEKPAEVKQVEKPPMTKPAVTLPEVETDVETPERPTTAPLFIKLDKYRKILNTLNYIRTTMIMITNSLSVLNELDRLRKENMKLIQDTLDRVNKHLMSLDAEFMRPSGLREMVPTVAPQIFEAEAGGLETTISDLKYQIEQLKADLETLT